MDKLFYLVVTVFGAFFGYYTSWSIDGDQFAESFIAGSLIGWGGVRLYYRLFP